MELVHLRVIVNGLDSLAAIEREHPALGARLLKFVEVVRDCCKQAYDRLSEALGQVRSLPAKPSSKQIEDLCTTLNAVSDSKWFQEVSHICDRLAALVTDFDQPLIEQLRYTDPYGDNWKASSEAPNSPRFAAYHRIAPLFSLLQKHEGELKDDIRTTVAILQSKLGPARSTGNVEEARSYALAVQEEISKAIDSINNLSYQIAGTASIDKILTLEESAEQALREPKRVLLINMAFMIVIVSLGAAVLQVISADQFVLLSVFAVAATIILNAFYLRTIDRLSEETFFKLVELATLKFFAPLTGRKDAKKRG